jgi:hypothetical protein
MKRKQVFQFSNQNWYPAFLKRDMYEFMTWFVGKVHAAKPFVPVISEGLQHAPAHRIINIDSQIGAGFETVKDLISEQPEFFNLPIQNFNTSNSGLYLFVNSFHQLKPEMARNYLSEIAKSRNAVVVVEGNNDSLWQVVGMTVFVPLAVILSAPLVKPFRVTRLIFTYLIPVLPIVTMLDGFLALFKLYNPNDLNELVSEIPEKNYTWKSAKADNGRGGKIMYLIGWPEKL